MLTRVRYITSIASPLALLPLPPPLLSLPAGLPPGVLNVVHGTNDTVNAILDHPDIAAVSFVGSSEDLCWVGRKVGHLEVSEGWV